MTAPCHILYIDDNKDSCEMVSMMLRFSDLNYEVTIAESAERAILLMKNQSFDLYIIDYALPKMSGVELCRLIRKSDSAIPILFFTALARPADRAEGLAAGANEYLRKPNDVEKLVETVKRLLNENSSSNCKSSVGYGVQSSIR